MATQQIFDDRSARLGSAIGRGLGGAAAGIGNIIDQRVARMEQQRLREQLGDAYEKVGLNRSVANLPESVQKQYVNQYLAKLGIANQQEQRAGAYSEFGLPQEHASLLARFPEKNQVPLLLDYVSRSSQQQQPSLYANLQAGQDKYPNADNQQAPQGRPGSMASLFAQPTPQQATERAMAQEKLSEQVAAPERAAINDLRQKYESSLEDKKELLKLQELRRSGKLKLGRLGSLARFLNLRNVPEEQIAEKSIDRLAMRFAKATGVGGKATNEMLKAYRRSLPSLLQTPEAFDTIVQSLLDATDLVEERYNAYNDILRENNNRIPANVSELINARIKPKIDQLNERLLGNKPEENSFISDAGQSSQELPPQEAGPAGSNPLSGLAQGAVQVGSKLASGALGAPASIASLGLGAANLVSGGSIPSYGELQEKLPISLPTSSQIESKIGEYLPEHYLEPNNSVQKWINTGAEELGAFAATAKLPFIGRFFSNVPWDKVLKTIGVSNVVPLAADLAGFDKDVQDASKFITLLGPVVYDATQLSSAADKLKTHAQKAGEKVMIPLKPIDARLSNIHKLAAQSKSALKDKVVDAVESLNALEVNGSVPASALVNVVREAGTLAQESTSLGLSKALKSSIEHINTTLSKTSPSFAKPYSQALSIEKGLEEGSKLHSWMRENLPTKISNPSTLMLSGLGLSKYTGSTLPALAAGGVATGYVERALRMLKHPGVRSHLAAVLTAATQRRGPMFANAVSRLDDQLNKIDSTQTKSRS